MSKCSCALLPLLFILLIPRLCPAQTAPCTFTVAPARQSVSAAGGTVSVALTASRGDCAWSAASDASWAILDATGGTGSKTIKITAAANDGKNTRSANIRAGETTAVITQPPRIPWRPMPDALSFTYQPGGPNPAPRLLGIWTGGSSLSYTIETSGETWFSVKSGYDSPTPGAASVSVDAGKLEVGVYRGQITVKAPEGKPAEQSIPVTLIVTDPQYFLETAAGMTDPADGASGTDWPLSEVTSMAADPSGNIYAADYGKGRILKLAPDGTMSVVWRTASLMSAPYVVAAGPDGAVYYAERLGNRIYRVTGTGSAAVVAGGGFGSGERIPATSAMLSSVGALAADGKGNLYFTEMYKVRCVGTDGLVRTVAGGGSSFSPEDGAPATTASLSFYSNGVMSVDGGGNLFLMSSSTLYKVSPEGTISTAAKYFFDDIIAAAPDGTVYGSDGASIHQVSGGQVVRFAGGNTAGLNGVAALVVDPAGSLFVNDAGNGLLRRIAPDGSVSTVAGVSGVVLKAIRDLAVDAAGTVWFVDSTAIRRLDPDGVVRLVMTYDSFSKAIGYSEGLTSITVNEAGEVYVLSYGGVIYKLASGGVEVIAGQGSQYAVDGQPASAMRFDSPVKIAAGRNGDILLASSNYQHPVWRITADGTAHLILDRLGFFGATNVAVDSAGRVYAGGESGGSVVMVTPEGEVQTVASGASSIYGLAVGPSDQVFYGNGAGFSILKRDGTVSRLDSSKLVSPDKSLELPYRMTVDRNGKVYYAGTLGDRIRALSPAGSSCAAVLSPPRLDLPAAGGSPSVKIRASERCGWTTEGSAPWITVTSASGTGDGTFGVRLAANQGLAPRVYTFAVAGVPLTVAQAGLAEAPAMVFGLLVAGAAIKLLTAPDAVFFITAPGGLALGDSIAEGTAGALELGGTTVEVNGRPATLLSAVPDRIVCVAPRETESGDATVAVKIFGTQVAAGGISVAPVAPGIILAGDSGIEEIDGYNAVTHKEGPFPVETPENPGDDKRTRIFFRVTGIRYADGRPPDGKPVDVSQYLRVEAADAEDQPLSLEVVSTGFDLFYPGVDLITVILPPEANRTPRVNIRVFVGDSASNTAVIRIRQNQ